MQQQGSNTQIIIQTETTFKATPSPVDAQVLPFVSEGLRLNRNLITSRTIRSDRNPQAPVRGNVDVAGDVSFELAHQYGRLLHHVFGGYAAVTGEGGSYTHTYTIGDLPAGLTVEKQFPDLDTPKYFLYNGCKVNSFKLSAKSEGFIDCSVSLMGAKETINNASFDGTPTDLSHSPFDGFSCSLTQGGVAVGIATQVDLTLDNNLDGNSYVIDGTGQRRALPAGTVKVSGTLTCVFENTTMYELAVAHTETSMTLVFTKGTGVGTAGNEKLTFYMDEMVFKPQAPVVGGPTGVQVELPFEAYYTDGAEASALRAILLTTVTHYG